MTKWLPTLSPTAWVTTQALLTQLIGLLLFAIQAPLLGPKAFGLVAIVMAFIGICEMLMSDASAECLISIRKISDIHYQTLTTVNVGAATLIAIVVFVAAPALAGWFNEPQLQPIFRWMALLPIIAAFSSAPIAATKREMQFRPLALRSIGGVLAAGVLGLVLTLLGAGVWALVWQAIAQRLVSVVVLWMTVPIRPRLVVSRPHLQELGRFVGPVMFSRVMNITTSSVPRFILGLYLGAVDVGLFSMASRLSDILQQLTIMPKFAVARVDLRQYAAGSRELDRAVMELFRKVSVMCFPICIVAAALTPTLFHAWLDKRWAGGIVATQLMLLTCVPIVTSYCATSTLMALNRQGSEALISTVQTGSILIVAWCAARFGLTIVALALMLRPLVLLPLPALYLRRCGVSLRTLIGGQVPALLVSLGFGAAMWALRVFLDARLTSVVSLAISACVSAVLYVLFVSWMLPEMARPVTRRLAALLGSRKPKGES